MQYPISLCISYLKGGGCYKMLHQCLYKLSPKGNSHPPTPHQSLSKLSQKENPCTPASHQLLYKQPKKEIPSPLHPINPYISYPKRENLSPTVPHCKSHGQHCIASGGIAKPMGRQVAKCMEFSMVCLQPK